MNSSRLFRLFVAFFLSVFIVVAQAQEEGEKSEEEVAEEGEKSDAEGEGESAAMPAIYLPLKPAFVVNYGGKGRLRYLKTELSVRLASTDAANSVRHHMPYLRHKLVMLFARQTEESINSQEGRELLRQDALLALQEVIKEEDGIEGVLDVYFNTFIVQN